MRDDPPVFEEVVVSELHKYDLPTKKQKTALEHYENKEKDTLPKLNEAKEMHPDEWDQLEYKPIESYDPTDPIFIGKGKKSGKLMECQLWNLASGYGYIIFLHVLKIT